MEADSPKQLLANRVDAVLRTMHYASPGIPGIETLITRPPNPEKGDLCFPVFKLVPAGENPGAFAQTFVHQFAADSTFSKFEAAGPYINVFLNARQFAQNALAAAQKVSPIPGESASLIMVEYASPNTNKPLHLGHLRNLALAESVIRMFEHEGNKIIRAQVVNDRGVHICKSMLAYQKWGNGKTPQSEKVKSDHFVGKYYVEFSRRAEEDPKLEEEAQALLVKWEQGDPGTRALWKKMNEWAVAGIFETYEKMGARFDVNYYESAFYSKGKGVVIEALNQGLFTKAENGAIIVPLEKKYSLPNKPVMRGDGTSLYFTQDIFLAMKRFQEYPNLDRIVYIVASEQEMHFKQLFATLELLGVPQASRCYHLGYGLLTLPSGKMSTRAGTVVDADELIDDLTQLALAQYQQRNPELGADEIARRSRVIGLAALKLYLVKQDARKELVFNPRESISFDGQTGPYLLYTNVRCRSILIKSAQKPNPKKADLLTQKSEKELLTLLSQKSEIIADALGHYSPHILAQYVLSLANGFNSYYHEHKIIQENADLEQARLALVEAVHAVLEEGLYLMGIETLREM